jgi:hypothetical protein
MQPLDVRPNGGGGPVGFVVDGAGNVTVTGALLVASGALSLAKVAQAPTPAPGQLQLYTTDGVNLALVGAGGQSAGVTGVAVYSRQIAVWAGGTASTVVATVGTWTPTYIANAAYYGWVNQSDGTQNDAISFDFACGAGTYQLDLYHVAFSSRGIYTVKIDGTTVGTVDGYAAGLTPEIGSITGIVLGAGTHTVTLVMATKNASSSGFIGQAERVMLTRTA